MRWYTYRSAIFVQVTSSYVRFHTLEGCGMKQFFERWVNTALHDYTLTVVLCMAVGSLSGTVLLQHKYLLGITFLAFAMLLMQAIREARRRRSR